jgi:hypothetical protein
MYFFKFTLTCKQSDIVPGVVDIGSKFAARVVGTDGKFATGVVGTDGALDLRISPQIFEKIRNKPTFIFRSVGEHDSLKKPEAKIS